MDTTQVDDAWTEESGPPQSVAPDPEPGPPPQEAHPATPAPALVAAPIAEQPPHQQAPPEPAPMSAPAAAPWREPAVEPVWSAESALQVRTRIFGGIVLRAWSFVVGASVMSTLLGAAGGYFIGRALHEPEPVVATPSSVSSASPELSLVERAADGDKEAMAAIAARPAVQRTAAESLALAKGALAADLAALRALERELKENPARLHEPAAQKLLRTSAYRADTHRETLRILAELPGPESADLLYLVWTGTAVRNEPTQLAEQLVYSSDVRKKASPALAVALALRDAEDCEARKLLLQRAIQHADHRSLPLLGRLKSATGCGPDKRGDCHPCLREGTLLEDAIKAAGKRAPSKL